MDMAGSITELVEGNFPVVSKALSKIIFKSQQDDEWYTCNLDGSSPQLLHDGLPNLAFPSASPDGKSLVMIDVENANRGSTTPIIVDIASGKIRKLDVPRGLWTTPVW
jgi:Tol biopolymer transport system component